MALVKDQFFTIRWHNLNKVWYESKGYVFTKWGDKFIIPLEDLTLGSGKIIQVICDYCGKEHPKAYGDYVKWKEKSPIKKDCCKSCVAKKNTESNQLVYGVNCTMQVPEHMDTYIKSIEEKYGVKNISQNNEVKNKKIKTTLENWGVPYAILHPEIQEKFKNTVRKNYGVDYPMQNSEILNKGRKALYLNGLVPCSNQQRYLHKLLGGELNYPVSRLSLDIAFPEDKIYIEYDGGGHDLSVKLNKITEKEFQNKEIRRYQFLKSKGWKQIKIISPYDYLPVDKFIIEEFKNALSWFKTSGFGYYHYIIDIGTKIESDDYGHLISPKKINLKEVAK